MESPMLQTNTEVETTRNKNMKLALAILFFIAAVVFLIVVVFTYGKSNQPSPAPTFTDEENMPVSSPGVAVGEPNPNTPIPTESELTYSFPEAYGFNIKYTAADWTVTTEPTQVNTYSPSTLQPNGNVLTLNSTSNPSNKIDFVFTKSNAGMLNENPLIVCSSVYKILREPNPQQGVNGLIRLDQGDSGTLIYSNTYYMSSENTSEMCVYNSHPIFKIENIEGGDNQAVPDTNDIYWIVTVYTGRDNTELDKVDAIVDTIKFK